MKVSVVIIRREWHLENVYCSMSFGRSEVPSSDTMEIVPHIFIGEITKVGGVEKLRAERGLVCETCHKSFRCDSLFK